MSRTTYWFWYGERCLTASRAHDPETARRQALASLDSCPGVYVEQNETPAEFRSRLHRATVRTYEGGR